MASRTANSQAYLSDWAGGAVITEHEAKLDTIKWIKHCNQIFDPSVTAQYVIHRNEYCQGIIRFHMEHSQDQKHLQLYLVVHYHHVGHKTELTLPQHHREHPTRGEETGHVVNLNTEELTCFTIFVT